VGWPDHQYEGRKETADTHGIARVVAHQPAAGAYTHGPEFWRLETPQRIALAQQIRSIIKASKNGVQPEE
jgi:hypothetical protein